MLNTTVTKIAVTCGLTTLLMLPGMAQLPRTWVSKNGNDNQNCSIDHPCRTFQRAHDQTMAYGEVNVLDPADYRLPFHAMLDDMEFTVVHELIHLELAPVLADLQRNEANRREEEHAVNHVSEALLNLQRGK